MILVDGDTYDVLQTVPCNLNVLPGLARVGAGIWCADRAEKIIVKFDVNTGKELDRILLPKDGPDPHGLTIRNQELWYSNADFPITDGMLGYPEIGIIQR